MESKPSDTPVTSPDANIPDVKYTRGPGTLGKWAFHGSIPGDHDSAMRSNPTLPCVNDEKLRLCRVESYQRGFMISAIVGIVVPITLYQLKKSNIFPKLSRVFIINSTLISMFALGNTATHFSYSAKLQAALWEKRLEKQLQIEQERFEYLQNLKK